MTSIGALGGARRDEVTPWGAVVPGDGSAMVDWLVAAEDRWHRPADEPSVRQRLIEGTPVVETRLRVPGGDVTHRVAVLPDRGGLTLFEVTNESPLPVAVALTRPDLWLVRPPTEIPTPGAELPPGSVVLPLGHRASLRAALAHRATPAGPLPGDLPAFNAVVRGWRSLCERIGRVEIPDRSAVDDWTSARCQAALNLSDDMAQDPAAWLLGCAEGVRLGEPADRWLAEAVGAVERLERRSWLRGRRRRGVEESLGWDRWRCLLAAETIARASGDERAARDALALLSRYDVPGDVPGDRPAGVRACAWFEDRLVRPLSDGSLALFPGGLQRDWFGASLEVHDLAVGGGRRLSFAVRWHGERPALLWEVDDGRSPWEPPSGVPWLRGGGLDPVWSSTEQRGEALLGVPPGAPQVA